MILEFGPIWARRDRGMLITRRGSKRGLIHSHSMRSQKNPRMLSIRAARPSGGDGLAEVAAVAVVTGPLPDGGLHRVSDILGCHVPGPAR
ncbi:hypothetical protein RGQ21_00310 [Kitasatospora aureofaciens]|nr:hypothetical protein RGQ21_00310 [Kitasatospora aureofaciens]